MELISVEQRRKLIDAAQSMAKLELRDHYALDAETLAAWRSGDPTRVNQALEASVATVAARVATGMTMRRIKVVSEPLSEYHRFTFDVSTRYVDAGEDIRWLPRRLVSILPLPGNDFFVLDNEMVIFNVLDGNDDRAEQQLYRDSGVTRACREAFEAAWALAVPYGEYDPS